MVQLQQPPKHNNHQSTVKEDFIKAGQLANQACAHAKELLLGASDNQSGVSMSRVCERVNTYITDTLHARIAFPCSISINEILCHSGYEDDSDCNIDNVDNTTVKPNDLVKIELGVLWNASPALITTSFVFEPRVDQPTKQQLIDATKQACQHLITQCQVSRVSSDISDTAKSYFTSKSEPYSFITGMMSHRLSPGVLSTDDVILLKAGPGDASQLANKHVPLEDGQVWAIDVGCVEHDPSDPSGPSCSVSTSPNHKTCIFAKSGKTVPLKLQASRLAYSKTVNKHGNFAFTRDQFVHASGLPVAKAKAALCECIAKALLVPYDVMQVQSTKPCARFLCTIMLTGDGPVMLTNPFDL